MKPIYAFRTVKPEERQASVAKATEQSSASVASKASHRKDTENSLQRRKEKFAVVEEHIPVWAQRGLFKQPGLGPRLKRARLAGRIKT